MKYIALLRGVNVGGKTLIKMDALKNAVENAGYRNVKTVIASGNVIFESPESNIEKIENHLEKSLKDAFQLDIKIIVKTQARLQRIIDDVPSDWEKRNDIRCYIAFTKGKTTPQDVIRVIRPKEGIDFIKAGEGVVYMTTLLSGLTKSGVVKLISEPVYKQLSLRYFSTVKKIAALL